MSSEIYVAQFLTRPGVTLRLATWDLPFLSKFTIETVKIIDSSFFSLCARWTSTKRTWKRHDDWETIEKNGEETAEIPTRANGNNRKIQIEPQNREARTAARKSAWFIKSSECMQTEEEIWSYVMWNIINLFTVLFRLTWIENSKARFITDLCLLISLVFDLHLESRFVLCCRWWGNAEMAVEIND
jgi:hypothetical protein